MYRTHTCGELRLTNCGETVTLAGWVQRTRDLGAMTFVDLRDRYGITQLVIDEKTEKQVADLAATLGREFVIQATGKVRERSSKNKNIVTGEIEIEVVGLTILNSSDVPPFTIEDESDGGDEIRMKYRYLDLRRAPVRDTLILRAKMAHATRSYLNNKEFIETETPVLIKSTPEGARDFVVPSRMNPGEFYALPQSPQTNALSAVAETRCEPLAIRRERTIVSLCRKLRNQFTRFCRPDRHLFVGVNSCQ